MNQTMTTEWVEVATYIIAVLHMYEPNHDDSICMNQTMTTEWVEVATYIIAVLHMYEPNHDDSIAKPFIQCFIFILTLSTISHHVECLLE